MLELDRSAIYRHRGDYAAYLQSKAARLEAEGQQTAAARNKLKSELNWVQRQPKARSTKSKSRLDAYELLSKKVKGATSRAAAAKGALTLEAGTQRLGSTIVKFEDASVDAPSGVAVLRQFSYDFKRGERVGIVGPNGAGKSTMLRALQQQLPLVGGEVEVGETVVFGVRKRVFNSGQNGGGCARYANGGCARNANGGCACYANGGCADSCVRPLSSMRRSTTSSKGSTGLTV